MSDYAQRFIAHLESLHEHDRAALAALRRSLGFAPGAYPPAYPYVEPFVAAERHAQGASRPALYVVAGLYATHPRQAGRSLASSLGELMRRRDSAGIEQRFIALLGADAENLATYLRRVVSLLAAGDLALDYAALLEDLNRWLDPRIDPERRDLVRQRWARDFYRALAAPASERAPTPGNA
ncbi:CRISPR system Cascade subunit CasB [Azotobacter beijerinckii]|uniref:CRISPR system Cascade subunit CasB n=1 Tax=Azotobacter beijerinckii TaxID=170623 RepID=A0A1H6WHU1_9GAMM|nr:type I-E CRISPR-associated protein Cse2/CasB [Azotobacter beijerinckii]SEJ14764.1 CRISPR system Cascade subunit CasB [Azotobacter beijerinckii]SEJ17313.1 CRISPR system Cascade subunit CasB [Azotobacter beijerinckii]